MTPKKIIASTLWVLSLVACGGGGGGSPANTLSINGVAATGAALPGGQVDAKCATGTAATTSALDGTFTLTSTTAQLPCLLRVAIPGGGYLHSVAESGASKANITPLTDLIAANVLGVNPSDKFTSFTSSDAGGITLAKIADAKTVLFAVATAAGVDLSGTDPLKDVFVATTATVTGDTKDKKIDAFMASLAAAGTTINVLSGQIATSKSASEATSQAATVFLPGGSSPTPKVALSQRYIGAAGVGELVQFDVNTDTLKFTYQILESQFGLTGVTKNGDLVANADGSYTQSSNTASRLRISSDGLLFGTISETFNSNNKNTLFFGSKNPSTSVTAIVGIYNFISRVCYAETGHCWGSYGTMKFESNGHWTLCTGQNLTDNPPLSYQPFTNFCDYADNGDYHYDGKYWRITANKKANVNDVGSDPSEIGTAIFTERAAGNILTLDLKDGRVGNNLGVGYLIGVTQQPALQNTTPMIFDKVSDDNTYLRFNIDETGRVIFNNAYLGTPQLDRPFTGFKTMANTGSISLQMIGTGVYFSLLPRTGVTAVGLRVESN